LLSKGKNLNLPTESKERREIFIHSGAATEARDISNSSNTEIPVLNYLCLVLSLLVLLPSLPAALVWKNSSTRISLDVCSYKKF